MSLLNRQPTPPPPILTPFVRVWQRFSPSLVPVLAVLTALIVAIPFMVITTAQGDIGRGLNTAFTAYAAFIEGSVGVAVNRMLTVDDVAVALQLSNSQALTNRDLRQLANRVDAITAIGAANVLRYAETIRTYQDRLDPAGIDALGERIPKIREIGADTLRAMQPLITALDGAISSTEALTLARQYVGEGSITSEQRASIEALLPITADLSDGDLLAYLGVIVNQNGVVSVQRSQAQLAVLDGLGLTVADAAALDFEGIFNASSPNRPGADIILELETVELQLKAAGITDEPLLARQLGLINNLYNVGVLTQADVASALTTELQPYIDANFVVYRPGNQPLLIDPGQTGGSGVIYTDANTPDDPSDDQPDTVYLQAGGSALLFFPFRLEVMLARAIAFVIAGLAVTVGFKAGLFNVGAEGQLYVGALLAVWIGFSPIFDAVPGG
ncbi:MAG: ABC transporter permease, partial [Armatimonadetes bacterium]|nr:ABC transporter permease [Anaerolineae bacterium]